VSAFRRTLKGCNSLAAAPITVAAGAKVAQVVVTDGSHDPGQPGQLRSGDLADPPVCSGSAPDPRLRRAMYTQMSASLARASARSVSHPSPPSRGTKVVDLFCPFWRYAGPTCLNVHGGQAAKSLAPAYSFAPCPERGNIGRRRTNRIGGVMHGCYESRPCSAVRCRNHAADHIRGTGLHQRGLGTHQRYALSARPGVRYFGPLFRLLSATVSDPCWLTRQTVPLERAVHRRPAHPVGEPVCQIRITAHARHGALLGLKEPEL
jgi:hypothetical protein